MSHLRIGKYYLVDNRVVQLRDYTISHDWRRKVYFNSCNESGLVSSLGEIKPISGKVASRILGDVGAAMALCRYYFPSGTVFEGMFNDVTVEHTVARAPFHSYLRVNRHWPDVSISAIVDAFTDRWELVFSEGLRAEVVTKKN